MTMDVRWCEHCDFEPATRRDGLGQACAAYRHKYRRLPPSDVLRERVRRAVEAELERQAWGGLARGA